MKPSAHLIGLCGAGMSAVAKLLLEAGYDVSGSDEGAYPPVSDYLDRIGLACQIGHRPENLPADPALVVIGKHAKLVPETNDEVAAALARFHGRVKSFPEVLADLTQARQRLVVAGSYGKSTLTTLIAWCMAQAGLEPGWFIGAIPKGLGHSSSLGGRGPFVFEGDEYPSANWDDRSKFLHYMPHRVILTAATHDHVNVFPTLASYHAPFHQLLSGLAARDGHLVACTDERYAAQFFHAYSGPKTSFGLNAGADYGAANIVLADPAAGTPTTFSLVIDRETLPGFSTTQLGRHSVQNICGAAATLIGSGLVSIDAFRDAVASFDGLERRLDRKAPESALPVYEGFGSSLEKARSAIEAMAEHFPRRRLVVLFEPHTFTWRNRGALDQYRTAFADTDVVFLHAPPDHGAQSHDQSSAAEILAAAQRYHGDVRPTGAGGLAEVTSALNPDRDVVLILSSGSFSGTLAPFLASLGTAFPAAR